jgi:pyruvate,water dikinase
MATPDGQIEQLLDSLEERAKELNCLYRVDEILRRPNASAAEVCGGLMEAVPPGWQYPEVCQCRIALGDDVYQPEVFTETPWCMKADIFAVDEKVGEIAVFYTERRPKGDEGPFLRDERRLINAIADRISLFVEQQRLCTAQESWERSGRGLSNRGPQPWEVLLEFLSRTDRNLLLRITRKMIHHLCWRGIDEAEALLEESLQRTGEFAGEAPDANRPLQRRMLRETPSLTRKTFEVAARHFSEHDVISCIQAWINEEKSTFLIESLENPGAGLTEMGAAIERYQASAIDETALPVAVQTGLKVALLRRYFIDQLEFLNVAKNFVGIRDFYGLVPRLIHPSRSQGKLGGKGASLFLAGRIIRNSTEHADLLGPIRIPRTWYVVSDASLEFIHYNSLEEVYNRKYMELERIRQDYSHIVQIFRNSLFPPEIVKGLAVALDDFGVRPLIVRSSSLLEDRFGSSFSGKYRSFFLVNQGTKEERLAALQQAIAEVYASVYSPDPIEYRAERGLLDYREEMGILIQEVVGRRIGKYFMPAFSGVALSRNESPWSAQIEREDGLVRLVPGLGTRAVGKYAHDGPVLFSPGRPDIRAGGTTDEVVRSSPGKIDVINLERNAFETIDAQALFRSCGEEYPLARSLVSIVEGDRIRPPQGLEPHWKEDDLAVTFEGLIAGSSFVPQVKALLAVLSEKLSTPVEIEFVHDGTDLYLVQCRPQSAAKE